MSAIPLVVPGRAEGNDPFARPYVVSWNLTYRCNLACEHCYLDAGPKPLVKTENFADRSELGTEDCFRVVDELATFAPEALTILTGGEPLLRRDILEIAGYAHQKGLWVVIGTNGVRITANLTRLLKERGVRGMALSLDALDPVRHDTFRRVKGAWQNTVEGARILHAEGLPFIVQTTVGLHNATELEALAAFAHDTIGASVWNLYFLVQSGRGQFVSDIEPERYDAILQDLHRIQELYAGRMVVNAKCAPHAVRTLFERDPESPLIRTYAGGAGGCPAGTHYMGIRPNGDVTPCPYLPVFGGNLRDPGASLSAIWKTSEVFQSMRKRADLGGKCGSCEFGGACGGCRARAWATTGDVMAADPLCSYEPGKHPEAVSLLKPALQYGESADAKLAWEPDALERIRRVPAFVRGMVVRAVEDHCRKAGLAVVTATALDEIRARMPKRPSFAVRPS
jgi:radical SAM protein with 4Fe4S-binding SPASM domain